MFECRRPGLLSMLLSCVLLAACEQAMIVGPVGSAQLTVTELRSGVQVSPDNLFTEDVAAARAGNPDFDNLLPIQQLALLGIEFLSAVPVQADTWYLVTASGGEDYGSDPATAVPVAGTWHALMRGSQISAGGFVVGPLSEAAYQWVKPFIDDLDDAQMQEALDEYSLTLVADLDQVQGPPDYSDLLTFNTLYHPPSAYTGDGAALDDMRAALGSGSSEGDKRTIAVAMVGQGAPKAAVTAAYDPDVSNIVQARCFTCHRSGGVAAATDHLLESTQNSNHVALNIEMYRDLVAKLGVQGVLDKGSGMVVHTGGGQLPASMPQYQTFRAFLELL